MADMHQLENKMRMIKLSGMVETLDMRLSQAQKEGPCNCEHSYIPCNEHCASFFLEDQ